MGRLPRFSEHVGTTLSLAGRSIDDDAQPMSFPFEVIATATACANAPALVTHKLALTPKPARPDYVFSESSDEDPGGKDEWLPDKVDSLADADNEVGAEMDEYPDLTSPVTSPFVLTARKTRKPIPQTCVKKKIVTLARVMMQRSDSVESYFRPAGHVANVVAVSDCDRGDFNNPSKPLLDGWLDAVDRKDKNDMSGQ